MDKRSMTQEELVLGLMIMGASLVVCAVHTEDALGAEDVNALFDHQVAQPGVQASPVANAAHFKAHRGHAVVMQVVLTPLLQACEFFTRTKKLLQIWRERAVMV